MQKFARFPGDFWRYQNEIREIEFRGPYTFAAFLAHLNEFAKNRSADIAIPANIDMLWEQRTRIPIEINSEHCVEILEF